MSLHDLSSPQQTRPEKWGSSGHGCDRCKKHVNTCSRRCQFATVRFTYPGGLSDEQFTYDEIGNVLTEDYDKLYRVTEVEQKVGGSFSPIETFFNGDYTYNGDRQRVVRTAMGVFGAQTTFRYLWSGSEILKDYHGNGNTRASYILGVGREAIKNSNDEGWRFYITDRLSSTRYMTDASGNITDSYTYTAYGAIKTSTSTPPSNGGDFGTYYNPFLFTGQQSDSGEGNYYLRNRYYVPRLGRFLNRDPIGFAGGLNLFSYGANNPATYTDHTGLNPFRRPMMTHEVTVTPQINGDILIRLELESVGFASVTGIYSDRVYGINDMYVMADDGWKEQFGWADLLENDSCKKTITGGHFNNPIVAIPSGGAQEIEYLIKGHKISLKTPDGRRRLFQMVEINLDFNVVGLAPVAWLPSSLSRKDYKTTIRVTVDLNSKGSFNPNTDVTIDGRGSRLDGLQGGP